MNYHNITTDDMLNGPGLRTVLWVAGCNHHCKECQNPETWDCNGGIPFDREAYDEVINKLKPSYISGLTLSGGDPLFPKNRSCLTSLVKHVKELFPNKNIWCYTGYLFEQIKDLPIVKYLDVLIDGEFKKELNDNNLHWVGSSNQRIIDVQKSLTNNSIILWR